MISSLLSALCLTLSVCLSLSVCLCLSFLFFLSLALSHSHFPTHRPLFCLAAKITSKVSTVHCSEPALKAVPSWGSFWPASRHNRLRLADSAHVHAALCYIACQHWLCCFNTFPFSCIYNCLMGSSVYPVHDMES